MGTDTPAWVPPEAGAVRALQVAVTLIDQDRAWKTRPARSRPIATRRCTTKGSGPAWTSGPASSAVPRPAGIVQASGVLGAGWWPGPRLVMALPRLVV